MSQEKVARYKEEKANRKTIMKKEKRIKKELRVSSFFVYRRKVCERFTQTYKKCLKWQEK